MQRVDEPSVLLQPRLRRRGGGGAGVVPPRVAEDVDGEAAGGGGVEEAVTTTGGGDGSATPRSPRVAKGRGGWFPWPSRPRRKMLARKKRASSK